MICFFNKKSAIERWQKVAPDICHVWSKYTYINPTSLRSSIRAVSCVPHPLNQPFSQVTRPARDLRRPSNVEALHQTWFRTTHHRQRHRHQPHRVQPTRCLRDQCRRNGTQLRGRVVDVGAYQVTGALARALSTEEVNQIGRSFSRGRTRTLMSCPLAIGWVSPDGPASKYQQYRRLLWFSQVRE